MLAECPIRSLDIEERERPENTENEDTENMNHIVERNGGGLRMENGCTGKGELCAGVFDENFRNLSGTLFSFLFNYLS